MIAVVFIMGTALAAYGVFSLVSYICEFPSSSTIKATKEAKTLGKKEGVPTDDFLSKIATPIAAKLSMDKLARQELEIALDVADNDLSPEMYTARCWSIFIMCAAVAIPMLLVSKIVALVILAVGAIIAFFKYRTVLTRLKEMREAVEREVPRFCTTVSEGLKTERDIIKIMTGYRIVASEKFREQLDKTLADMKSSNYEAALLRFDYRISSPYLSDVIKGLLGALRGDDQSTHFAILTINLKSFEKSLLAKKAFKKPAKMNRISLCMLLGLIILYVVVFATVIMESLASFNF